MTNPSRLALGLWLLLLALSAVQVFGRTQVESDLSAFLPPQDQSAASLLLEELQSGRAAQVILVGISGDNEAARATASKVLGERLRAAPEFSYVGNGQGERDMSLLELLLEHRYLLSPAVDSERFGQASLQAALQQRLQELASPVAGFDRRWLPQDPTAELRTILQQWSGGGGPAHRLGVWFSADGSRALLLVRTHAKGFDLEAQQRSIALLRSHFSAMAADGLELSLSGPGVFAVNARATIEGETQLLSAASTLLMVLLLLIAYRSPRLLLLGALPLASGMLAATAMVSLVFGGIHGITLAFGVTLLGVALDYPLHVFSHLNGRDSPEQCVRAIWPTVRLGVITTAAGYAALGLTDFAGLAQLGLFTVVGLLVAAAISRWILPGLIPTGWSPRPGRLGAWISHWAMGPNRAAAVTAVLVLVTVVVYLARFEGEIWEDDLGALSPIAEADRQLDRQLRAEMGAPEVRDLVLIQAPDPETLLQRSEALASELSKLAEAGALDGFELPSRYLPSARTQLARRALLPSPEELQSSLAAAAAGTPFNPRAFEPFLSAMAAAKEQPPLTLAKVAGTGLELRLLPLMSQQSGEWRAFVPLQRVQDRGEIANALASHASEGVRYLDLKTASNQLLVDFRDEALARIALGIAVIMLVLWIGLRSLAKSLLILAPIVAAAATDLALLLWIGERLSLFHLVSLLLVVGIGLDYSLFFARSHDAAEQRQTLHALAMCAASTISVFGLLGMSAVPVLRAIGLTVGAGVALCLFFAWALRPRPALSSLLRPHFLHHPKPRI